MKPDKQKIRELLEELFYRKLEIDYKVVRDFIEHMLWHGRFVYVEGLGLCYEPFPFYELKFEEKSLDILRPTLKDMIMKNHDTQKPLRLRDSL